MSDDEHPLIALRRLNRCFEGAVPAVIATGSGDGSPNVTYLSRVRMVDDERIALSNQFFSKTARNLTENPRASVLLIDPVTYDQYRLTLAYERTDRRGPVFERLREDVDITAAMQGMQDVFKLRAADIYRVLRIEQVPGAAPVLPGPEEAARPDHERIDPGAVSELSARIARCGDLNALFDAALAGLAELFGYQHALLLLLDETGTRLYTIASHGYDEKGVGSEVVVGEGVVGVVAARCAPIVVGDVRQLAKYSRRVRRSFEDHGAISPGREIPVPGLPGGASHVAVPAMVLGELVGALLVESREPAAFGAADVALLSMVASLVASAVEVERAREAVVEAPAAAPAAPAEPPAPSTPPVTVRFFALDGSTFVNGDYLIKGVAGRILWSLLCHYQRDGRVEFTNREVRLDPSLELPGFRDNFESRLILLKRRLDENGAPVRIEKNGRGRFRLEVATILRLEAVATP